MKFTLIVLLLAVSPLAISKDSSTVKQSLKQINIKAEEVKFYSHQIILRNITPAQKQEVEEKLSESVKKLDEARVELIEAYNMLDSDVQRQMLLEKEKSAK
ncbi:MAG: hypothetical protein HN576_14630 [Bacteriovoracaceae bacterium]|jgi:hypothetical protein|nr:hypothetical protein [Bacteriovoracaceae bacterium]